MDAVECIKTRMSIRKFKPEPVPKEVLMDVFDTADIPEPESWPSHIDMRIRELFRKRSEKFGIDFSEPVYIKKAKIANFRFYGAPHGIFLFHDASLPLWSLFDIGLFAQSLMLAAHAYGLGTVPQAFLTDYSHEVKKFLGISESKRLVLGISIGYPDLEDRANSFRTDRVDVNEIVKWVE